MTKIKKIIFVIIILFLCTIKVNSKIEDSLFITVGNIAITKLDIVNEIKIILILSNASYTDDKRDMLNTMAIKSVVRRSVKTVEIKRNNFLQYSKKDLNRELESLATNLNLDLDTLKNICESNELDFSLIVDQVKTSLLWNSLIFQIYKDNLRINAEDIEDQLKLIQNKKEFSEYLISEILFKYNQSDSLESQIEILLDKIKAEGFENVAMNLSISESNIKGGDLGWLSENVISEKLKSKIINTKIGKTSEPIVLPEGILIFRVRDIRKVEQKVNLEEAKDKLVNFEKKKILNMYSLSHYDKLRRSVPVKFYNE